MHETARFEAEDGTVLAGVVTDQHPSCGVGEAVFEVAGRAWRVDDLAPGRLTVLVERRSLGAMALVEKARRGGFTAALHCKVPPDSRRDRRRRH